MSVKKATVLSPVFSGYELTEIGWESLSVGDYYIRKDADANGFWRKFMKVSGEHYIHLNGTAESADEAQRIY